MPNLLETAQRLAEPETLALLQSDRCLVERDLNATCSACVSACPIDAIALGSSREAADAAISYGSVTKEGLAGPHINEELCRLCGRCITACPTGALLPLTPYDDNALLRAVARAGAAAGANAGASAETATGAAAGTPSAHEDAGEGEPVVLAAGFACERAIESMRLDAERTVVLPCLGWLDEALLVHMACSGARRIVVLATLCPTCEVMAAVEGLEATVKNAQNILATWGLAAEVELVTSNTSEIDVAVSSDTSAVGEVTRRGLLSQAGASLLEAASEAAAAQMRSLVGAKNHTADTTPELDRRRWQLLDDLHAAGLPGQGAAIVPRSLAPRVDIDVDRCSGCALCAQFCPTNALHKVGKVSGGKTLLEFDAALCRDCGVCTETCRYGALSCEETLTASELFALEPHALVIPKRRVLPSRR